MNEANHKNPIGPPTAEGSDYLSVYAINRRRNSLRGGADLARTLNRTSQGSRLRNGWADLADDIIEVGRSGVPGPNQARLGQQKLNLSFVDHDPSNYFQNSF